MKSSVTCALPSLDQICDFDECWYCSYLCHHCMQPSNTPHTGSHEDKVLRFCSKECQQMWFPTSSDQSIYATCFKDKKISTDYNAPLMSVIKHMESCGVEEIYLSVERETNSLEESTGKLFVVWHKREIKSQQFFQFYISSDCLPVGFVWEKQICCGMTEVVSSMIAKQSAKIQAHLLKIFNEAAKKCGFEDYKEFLTNAQASCDEVSSK